MALNLSKEAARTIANPMQIAVAQSVAQQIGKNLGFYLDFLQPKSSGRRRVKTCGPGKYIGGPDNDLMNLGSPRQSKWSACTNEDFRNYYSRVGHKSKSFCLQEGKFNSVFHLVFKNIFSCSNANFGFLH